MSGAREMADSPGTGGNENSGSQMFSSYLGRWVSLLALLLLMALAAAALFLEPEYPAHVPLRIGVCAFDSSKASPALTSFASRVREEDGGDITWIWLGPEGSLEGCDFYLMTAVQAAGEADGPLRLLLTASSRSDGSADKGVVVVREGTEPDWSEVVFTSPLSSNGFLSPLAALAGSGADPVGIRFAGGCPVCGEAVAYGVLQGAFGAGGMPLETLRRMEADGSIEPGALTIALTGPALPGIVLLSDSSTEEWKSRGFARRLPRIVRRLSDPLRREMAGLGMAAFEAPADVSGSPDAGILEMVPAGVWKAAGRIR
jgi:hypothetical protein